MNIAVTIDDVAREALPSASEAATNVAGSVGRTQ